MTTLKIKTTPKLKCGQQWRQSINWRWSQNQRWPQKWNGACVVPGIQYHHRFFSTLYSLELRSLMAKTTWWTLLHQSPWGCILVGIWKWPYPGPKIKTFRSFSFLSISKIDKQNSLPFGCFFFRLLVFSYCFFVPFGRHWESSCEKNYFSKYFLHLTRKIPHKISRVVQSFVCT